MSFARGTCFSGATEVRRLLDTDPVPMTMRQFRELMRFFLISMSFIGIGAFAFGYLVGRA